MRGLNSFTEDWLNTARDAFRHGAFDVAWTELGIGTHGPLDLTSPQHRDKVWCGSFGCPGGGFGRLTYGVWHIFGETLGVLEKTPGVYDLTDQAIRDAYSFVTGRTLSCK